MVADSDVYGSQSLICKISKHGQGSLSAIHGSRFCDTNLHFGYTDASWCFEPMSPGREMWMDKRAFEFVREFEKSTICILLSNSLFGETNGFAV